MMPRPQFGLQAQRLMVCPFSQSNPPACESKLGDCYNGALTLRLFQHKLVIVSAADGEMVAELRRDIDALAGQGIGDILNPVHRKLAELAGLFLRPCAAAGRERRAVAVDDPHFNSPHGIPFPSISANAPHAILVLDI